MTAPPIGNPVPRGNAKSRAEIIRNQTSYISPEPNVKADFAVIYFARPVGLAMRLAHALATLVENLGGRWDETGHGQPSGSGGLPCHSEQASPRGRAVGRGLSRSTRAALIETFGSLSVEQASRHRWRSRSPRTRESRSVFSTCSKHVGNSSQAGPQSRRSVTNG